MKAPSFKQALATTPQYSLFCNLASSIATEALSRISGVGEKKRERYGDALLGILRGTA